MPKIKRVIRSCEIHGIRSITGQIFLKETKRMEEKSCPRQISSFSTNVKNISCKPKIQQAFHKQLEQRNLTNHNEN